MVAIKPVMRVLSAAAAREVHLINLTTDLECTLYLIYAHKRPVFAAKPKITRGVFRTCGYGVYFKPLGILSQWQPGPSKQHTFAAPSPPARETLHFAFIDNPIWAVATWTSAPLQALTFPGVPPASPLAPIAVPVPASPQWYTTNRMMFWADDAWWLVLPNPTALQVWRLTPSPPTLAVSWPPLIGPMPRIALADARLAPDGKTIHIAAAHQPAFTSNFAIYHHRIDVTSPVLEPPLLLVPPAAPPAHNSDMAMECLADGSLLIAHKTSAPGDFHHYVSRWLDDINQSYHEVPVAFPATFSHLGLAKSDPLGQAYLAGQYEPNGLALAVIPYLDAPHQFLSIPGHHHPTRDYGIAASFDGPTVASANTIGQIRSYQGIGPFQISPAFGTNVDMNITLISRFVTKAAQTCAYTDLAALNRYAQRYEDAPWTDAGSLTPDIAFPQVANFSPPNIASLAWPSNLGPTVIAAAYEIA